MGCRHIKKSKQMTSAGCWTELAYIGPYAGVLDSDHVSLIRYLIPAEAHRAAPLVERETAAPLVIWWHLVDKGDKTRT